MATVTNPTVLPPVHCLCCGRVLPVLDTRSPLQPTLGTLERLVRYPEDRGTIFTGQNGKEVNLHQSYARDYNYEARRWSAAMPLHPLAACLLCSWAGCSLLSAQCYRHFSETVRPAVWLVAGGPGPNPSWPDRYLGAAVFETDTMQKPDPKQRHYFTALATMTGDILTRSGTAYGKTRESLTLVQGRLNATNLIDTITFNQVDCPKQTQGVVNRFLIGKSRLVPPHEWTLLPPQYQPNVVADSLPARYPALLRRDGTPLTPVDWGRMTHLWRWEMILHAARAGKIPDMAAVSAYRPLLEYQAEIVLTSDWALDASGLRTLSARFAQAEADWQAGLRLFARL